MATRPRHARRPNGRRTSMGGLRAFACSCVRAAGQCTNRPLVPASRCDGETPLKRAAYSAARRTCCATPLTALPFRMAPIQPARLPTFRTHARTHVQVTDGAGAALLMTRAEAVRRGLPILGIFRSFAAVGVDPSIMGVGPAVAIPAAVKMAGLSLDDIDVYEINEAFASQVRRGEGGGARSERGLLPTPLRLAPWSSLLAKARFAVLVHTAPGAW